MARVRINDTYERRSCPPCNCSGSGAPSGPETALGCVIMVILLVGGFLLGMAIMR